MFYPDLDKVKQMAYGLELLARSMAHTVDNIEEGRGEQNPETVEAYANELSDLVVEGKELLATMHKAWAEFMRNNKVKMVVRTRNGNFKFDM